MKVMNFIQGTMLYQYCIDLLWFIRHRTTDVYHTVDLCLKPGFHDADARLERAVFELNRVFVDVELKQFAKLVVNDDYTQREFWDSRSESCIALCEVNDWYLKHKTSSEDNALSYEEEKKQQELITKHLITIIENREVMWT